MNNEPVTWTKKDTLIFLGNYEFGSITIQVQKQKDDEFDIPLYTHPAKTLTDIVNQAVDEFIAKIEKQALDEPDVSSSWTSYAVSAAEMVRIAILRKAQEK